MRATKTTPKPTGINFKAPTLADVDRRKGLLEMPATRSYAAREQRIIAALRVWKGMRSEEMAKLLGEDERKIREIRGRLTRATQSQATKLQMTPRQRMQGGTYRNKAKLLDRNVDKTSKNRVDSVDIAKLRANQTLGHGCCAWILGDGPFLPGGAWGYCNVPTGSPSSYCEDHEIRVRSKSTTREF
jgi:hypothetical protein